MKTEFQRQLARVRRIYAGGLLLAAALRLAAAAAAALLGALLFDALFAFDEPVRITIGLLLLLGAAAFAAFALVTTLALPRRAIAAWADSRLSSRRRPVLSALELAAAPPPDEHSAFGPYLVDRALERGRDAVAGLSFAQLLPRRILRRTGLQLAGALATWILLAAIWTVPVRTHLLRLLAPARDIPPWSRLAFTLSPENPAVVYGDSLEITAAVDGPLGATALLFEMRDATHAYRSAGFREATNRYVHRLERVVQPLRYRVRAGRAHSRWHELSILYQPRIASARVTLAPPAYAGLPPRQFYLGGQKLAGLRGSRVTLDLTANRPLQRGFLLFTRPDGSETRVDGRAPGDATIRFEWTLDDNASVTIHVQDPLGTPNARSHAFTQERLPDEPPSAALLEPPRYSLATPDSLVAIEALAEDSLGLRAVALVRSLAGYRDRPHPVGLAAGARQARIADSLDLARIGARPGDSLELYLEAADTNPDLLGNAMSDISRIDVISPDEYAEILRLRTAVAEFGERYRLLSRQLEQLRDALQALAENSAPEAPAREDLIRQALDAWNRLDENYRRIGEDFAIFDHEKLLPPVLKEIRAKSEPHAQRLGGLENPFANAPAIARNWLDALADPAARLEDQARDAALADQLMQVARSALQLQLLIDRQAALVRSLSRYEANLRATPAAVLEDFARTQAHIAESLNTWLSDTSALADALPKDQRDLAREMREVIDAIRDSRAPLYMERATTAAQNQNAPDAHRHARDALEALRAACNRCDQAGNCYAGMCRNPGQGFRVKDSLANTLRQLCQALARQFGSAHGSGGLGMGGGGFGGDASDGYWTSGSSLLDVPLHGPPRHALQALTGHGGGHDGTGRGRTGAIRATHHFDRQSTGATPTRAVSLDEIPERYREPARLFYNLDAPPGGTPP